MELDRPVVDLVVIGGGINGTGIARDAAGRGLSVVLCEQGDLACATSSASSKLIHGGLRYLEQFDFILVHKALRERERLQQLAPHLIHPLEIFMPHANAIRPAWQIQLGLWAYDRLAFSRAHPRSQRLPIPCEPYSQALQPNYKEGFLFTDCQTDDARLVIANALGAKELGAQIQTHTRVVRAFAENKHWHIETRQAGSEQTEIIKAKSLINATGPFAKTFTKDILAIPSRFDLALVQGSHIVVPKLYPSSHAYMLQNPDGRIVFVLPYLNDYSLIGTTDLALDCYPTKPTPSKQEIDYLLQTVNSYFTRKIDDTAIVWSFAGVRPLVKAQNQSASTLSRDYELELITSDYHAPLLNVYGGKLTTYRHLSEEALNKLGRYMPAACPGWTHRSPLPGGNFEGLSFKDYLAQCCEQYNAFEPVLIERYCRAYGSLIHELLRGYKQPSELGEQFGGGLSERELEHCRDTEWASTAEDVLWRRSKLGLALTKEEIDRVVGFMGG